LNELAEALRDCSSIDLGRSEIERIVQVPSEGTKTGFRSYTISDYKLFDWTELDLPAAHLSLLSEAAETIAQERRTKGRREDIRRHTFAIAVGAMWWQLTGIRPTSNNVDFGDFLAAAEGVFFANEDTASPTPENTEIECDRDVSRLVNSTATLFRGVRELKQHRVPGRLDDIYLARIEAAECNF